MFRDFPGSPVVKIPCFQFRGHWFNPDWGTKGSLFFGCKAWPKKDNNDKLNFKKE